MKIGWIGLGAMGTPMAARLCDTNLEVSVYNRTESKAAPLKEKGVAVYTNPIDLAAKVDLVFIMLSGNREQSSPFKRKGRSGLY
ncbi:3-hydroxyisobutyrate dehydrogenase [Helicobacter pylori NY40]|uniref:3-hydroxyisobutyrate dehydrogenase n=1 Tax=Helicobacter pylori NY40 TaxID=1426844 RepID=A0A060PVJ0_HELPX|nr:3-hydroxyisobutyrate dehydrogenase [Helicobacter pylori NY40]